MYGTVARYRLKPGMEEQLLQIEAELRATKPPQLHGSHRTAPYVPRHSLHLQLRDAVV